MTDVAAEGGKDGRSGGRLEATGISIELVIECVDEAVAKALDEALMPDNRYFPKDQRFNASREGASITFHVESPRPRPALSTMTSIIADSRLFRDVWVEAKTRGLGNAPQR